MLSVPSIVERFLATKMQVHPDVVSYIREHGDEDLIDRIIASVPAHTLVVSVSHIPGVTKEKDGVRFTDPQVEITQGKEGSCRPVDHIKDYVQYFRNRYDRLGQMVGLRCSIAPIFAIKQNYRLRQKEVTVCGMVADARTTNNGHRMIELEDKTGTCNVLFNKDRPEFDEAERIIPDEVIGVRGTVSSQGTIIFGDQLFRPDIPFSFQPYCSKTRGKAVLISDIHVGSDTFLEEAWLRFTDWLRGSDISYLLIAGDLVDGIGIYPGQDQELIIPNIYAQYDALGKMFSSLPSHIQIVCAPGNHDVVRGAEPQPAIPRKFTSSFPPNCIFVENPATVNLQGVRILMYHGRSFDDMIGLIPGASYEQAHVMMTEMLKRRHLALCYGKKTPIAADKIDRMVIDPIPEVLHTGHVHIMGITKYRGVLGINAGTWQSQTAFQKQMNIQPTPAKAVVLNLQTLETEVMDFE